MVANPEIDACTVTGLTNGTPYTFTVTATNGTGTGPAGTSNPATPSTTPDAPTAIRAVDGDGQIEAMWSAPSFDGGSPVTAYAVTAQPGGEGCTTTGAESSCLLVGLSNGVAYTLSFSATNVNGTGPAAVLSPAVTPAAPPSTPLNPAVTVGVSSATVTWDTPASDGGSPITGYTVLTGHGAHACVADPGDAGTRHTCTITGLTPGKRVSVHVVASNAVGDSPQATTSALVGVLACTPGLHLEMRHGLLQSTTDFVTWTKVGTEDAFVNGFGYRPADGFLYGIGAAGGARQGSQNHLLRIAGDGSITDLGLVAGLPSDRTTARFPAGTFDPTTDRLIVAHGLLVYSIDVDTEQATAIALPAAASPIGWSMALDGSWLWTPTSSGIEGINLDTQAVVTYALPADFPHSGYGAAWLSADGQTLSFESNSSGRIYAAQGLGGGSVSFSQVGSVASAARIDGASCPSAG